MRLQHFYLVLFLLFSFCTINNDLKEKKESNNDSTGKKNEKDKKINCNNELNYDSSRFANDSTYKYLPGKWHMVEYDKSAITPRSPKTYDKNEVIWNFKGDSDSLIISIYNDSIDFWQIEDSRSYSYKLDSGTCSDVYDNYNSLYLNGKDKGVLMLHNKDSMTLSDACLDGWVIKLAKCVVK